MGDRRRHQRFVFSDACEGTFQLLEDVTIESMNANEVCLVSTAPARIGEVVSVEVPGGAERSSTVLRGTVADSRPIMTNGRLQHRVLVKLRSPDRPISSPDRSGPRV